MIRIYSGIISPSLQIQFFKDLIINILTENVKGWKVKQGQISP